jgi:hydroxymethylpyrimidine/phosphomethylpyrimidine kinase
MKYFLTIAASDNSGGAGIQQDIKIANNLGFWSLSAITGITVQNFNKLYSVNPVPARLLLQQIGLNLKSFNVGSVKIGAICSEENIKVISALLKKYKLKNVVLDTVFSPTKGKAFISKELISSFKNQLLPYVYIITPNKEELSVLADHKITDFENGITAAKDLGKEYGCRIYLKGGHFEGLDIPESLIEKNKVTVFNKKRLNLKYSHGTGCTFSTALSCFLGNGLSVDNACEKASSLVSKIYGNLYI